MRIYAVTFEVAVNVIAPDEDEAERVAARHVCDQGSDSFLVLSTREGEAADGWPDSAIPYCDVVGGNVHGKVGAWLRAREQ